MVRGWYMDNSVTNHMTGSQEFFETLVEWDLNFHMVLGDKSLLEIRGSSFCHSGWIHDV